MRTVLMRVADADEITVTLQCQVAQGMSMAAVGQTRLGRDPQSETEIEAEGWAQIIAAATMQRMILGTCDLEAVMQ